MSVISRVITAIRSSDEPKQSMEETLSSLETHSRQAEMAFPTKTGLFKKRRNIFIRLIYHQAALTFEGLEALNDYMATQDQKTAELVVRKEKEADEARRILICELNKTFVTPFDREDIFALSRTIDDVLDYAYSTLTEMDIFKVTPTPFMQQIVSLLRDAAYELMLGVNCLEDHQAVVSEHARRAKSIENRIEGVYREALADLFEGGDDIKHVLRILKSREVYRHLSNAADRVDEAANVLSDIVVKTS